MFSSSNNLHLFPLPQYFPSSSSTSSSYHLIPPLPLPPPLPPLLPPPETNQVANIFIHQDPLPLPSAPFLGTSLPLRVVEEASAVGGGMKNEQQDVVICQNGVLNNFVTKKSGVKKDRHSKIYTAQGLRDRRVRLSIDISRKFFDLQDMLGYDKASKTLDWLLTKSKKAIKDLTKTRRQQQQQQQHSSEDQCEVISSETNHHDDDDDDDDDDKVMGKFFSKKNNMSMGGSSSSQSHHVHDVMVKESRAKARARARERTKEKIMNKKSQNHQVGIPEILLDQTAAAAAAASSSSSQIHQQKENNNNIIGIMWKPTPIAAASAATANASAVSANNNSNYQKNLMISSKLADHTSSTYYYNNNNFNNFYFPTNLPQNWDINVDAFPRPQSGFCSISNIDSFPEFQLCGKPWDACNNNQHLH